MLHFEIGEARKSKLKWIPCSWNGVWLCRGNSVKSKSASSADGVKSSGVKWSQENSIQCQCGTNSELYRWCTCFCNLDKFNLQFGQIHLAFWKTHFAIWTNMFTNLSVWEEKCTCIKSCFFWQFDPVFSVEERWSIARKRDSVVALCSCFNIRQARVLTLDRQGFIFEEGFRRRAGRVHKQLLKRAETNSLQQGHLRWERLQYFWLAIDIFYDYNSCKVVSCR